MKRILLVSIIFLLLTGCGKLAKFEDEDAELVIDIRDKFDPSTVLKDVKEGTEISYSLDEENSKLVITLKNGDKEETLEKSITIQYPLGELLCDKIDYYTYKEFDSSLFIKLAEGVKYDYEIDIDNATITYTLTKDNRLEEYKAGLNIINSLSSRELVAFRSGGTKETTSRLNLDGQEYYVFTLNNNEAFLLSVEPIGKMAFNSEVPEEAVVNPFLPASELEKYGDYNHNGVADEYEDGNYNYYEGSSIDNYLENDFYMSLSDEVKKSIVEKDIVITSRGGMLETDYVIGRINRHVYLGDVTDFDGISLSKMRNDLLDNYFTLRTRCSYNQLATWAIWVDIYNIDYWNIVFVPSEINIRPMFVVNTDLLPETVLVN